jgi:hypothetical protein
MAMSTKDDVSSLAVKLNMIGASGVLQLNRSLQPHIDASSDSVSQNEAEAGFVIHAHALVWYGIAAAVPAEIGMDLMSAHLRTTHQDLVISGCPWPYEQLEASVRDAWLRFYANRSSGGQALFALCSGIFASYLGRDSKNLVAVMDLVPVVTDIIGSVRDAVAEVYPDPETSSTSHEGSTPPIVIDGDTNERYPLEIKDVASLAAHEIKQHIAGLDAYPNAMTLAELRRRKQLQVELGRRNTNVSPLHAPGGQPTVVLRGSGSAELRENKGNPYAVFGFILGILSVVAWPFAMIPIGAMIWSAMGLNRAKKQDGQGHGIAVAGLVLGMLFSVLHLLLRALVAVAA